MWDFFLKINEEFKQVFCINILNDKSVEPSFKSLKTSCFGREFCSVFDNWKCLSVQVVSEHPSLVKWRVSIWLWPKDSYIKMNFMENFQGTYNGAFESLTSSLFYNRLLAKVKHLHFKSPSSGVPTPLERSLNIINCQKWSENPFQNMSFWQTLSITLFRGTWLHSNLNIIKSSRGK